MQKEIYQRKLSRLEVQEVRQMVLRCNKYCTHGNEKACTVPFSKTLKATHLTKFFNT